MYSAGNTFFFFNSGCMFIYLDVYMIHLPKVLDFISKSQPVAAPVKVPSSKSAFSNQSQAQQHSVPAETLQ